MLILGKQILNVFGNISLHKTILLSYYRKVPASCRPNVAKEVVNA